MVRCGDCGNELPPEFGEIKGQPCPECGSTLRGFHMNLEPGHYLTVGQSPSMIHTRPGTQSTAAADDQKKITLTASGPAPRNEEDALNMCARLVRFLNSSGLDWSVPVEGEQDIDGCSTNAAGERLNMQVVRASNNANLWRGLSESGCVTMSYTAQTVADELLEAILNKSSKYPPAQKKEMTLVLDAARTPSHTFNQVHNEFQTRHLEKCQKAGFLQVWAVGPQDCLVKRLDR